MVIRKALASWTFFVLAWLPTYPGSLTEQFKHVGYVEIADTRQAASTFDTLYAHFDTFITFLQTHPAWARTLYRAKERFARSPDKKYYSTDFVGLYDESHKIHRRQICFYYSTHFHECLVSHYREFSELPEISNFLQACYEIQKSYGDVFNNTALELGLSSLFAPSQGRPPILVKVVKYLPLYTCTKPHYDGTAFSLFLDSTDHQSLLLAPYKPLLTPADFAPATRKYFPETGRRSVILIPGALLTEFSIYPTPHIVQGSGKTRYATIAFAMRPHYIPQKNVLAPLPTFT